MRIPEFSASDFASACTLAAALLSGGAGAATWCVPGVQPGCDFGAPTIQAAIDAAVPGDTVRVAAGDYGEMVSLAKTLQVLGVQAGVDARTREGQPESRIRFRLVLQAGSAGSVIDGFAFDGGPSGIGTNPMDPVVLDGLSIRNNRFAGFSAVAIGLGGRGDDITIDRNYLDGSAIDHPDNLITLIGPGPFHGFRLTNNKLVGGGGAFGVGLGSGEGQRHVGPSATRAPLIRGNAFEGLVAGMMTGNALDRAEISDNEFRSMRCISLSASPAHSRIEGNRFVDNGSTAIMLGMAVPSPPPPDPSEWGAHHNTITGNLVFNSAAPVPGRCEFGVGIVLSDGQAPGTMATNQLHGNAIVFNNGGLSYPGPDTIDARNNYWGAADGPFHPVRNPSGSGNSVGDQQAMWGGPGMVLFDPWLAGSPIPMPPIPPARTWCVPGPQPGCDVAAPTIQAAINAAFPGETIKVAPGDYNEALSLPKRLQLLGAQAGVDARGRVGQPESRIVSPGGQLTLRFGPAGSVIDGFTFHGGFVGIQSEPMQVTPLDGLHIRNNRFTGLQDSGIALRGSGADITIDRNYVDGSGSTYGGPLVNLGNDGAYPGFRLTNNEILNGGPQRIGFQCGGSGNMGPSASRIPSVRGNTFSGNLGAIVLLDGPLVSGEISDNIFANNDHGVHAGFAHATVAGNTFQGNAGFGIQFAALSHDNVVSGNQFIGNGATPGTGHGLIGSLTSTVVANNVFRDNNGAGVALFGPASSGNAITDNEFVGNAGGGLGAGPLTDSLVARNVFRANGAVGVGAMTIGSGAARNTVTDNEFRDNATSAMRGSLSASLVARNTFTGNLGFAISLLSDITGNTITGNLILGNGVLGTCDNPIPAACGGGFLFGSLYLFPPVSNDVSGNTISGNRVGAMYVGPNAIHTRDMRGNYWGATTGPFHAVYNPAGEGNAVIDQATDRSGPGRIPFDPWLMLEPGTTPLTLVEDVAAGLSALLPKSTRSVDHSLQRAYDAVVASLAAQYWGGDFTLTASGHMVFVEQRKAVKELEDVVKASEPRSAMARLAIDDLLLSEEVVARTAINLAVAAGGNPAEIARARDALSRAQLEQSAGDWDNAVDSYRKAWEHATRAA
jgi:nitrous oxidase accessory protein NosD